MTDVNQVPGAGAGTPAQNAPVQLTEARILELIQQGVSAGIDARIPGLQSAYDSQLSSLKKDVQGLRRASMTQDEIEESEASDLRDQLAQERQARLVAEAALKYPSAVETYQALMSAKTVEEQLAYLQTLQQAPQAQPEPAAPEESEEGEQQLPPVDPNNPQRQPSYAPGGMTQDQADRILDQFGSWPGRG